MGWSRWIHILLDDHNKLPVDMDEKQRILQFGTVLLEQIWLVRNKIRVGGVAPNWDQFAKDVLRLSLRYVAAAGRRTASHKKILPPEEWIPPPLGQYKFNLDVSYFDNFAISAIVF